ncbi:Basic salivary proline-rich protein 2 isoform X1 [Oopsacas minuta]|uniref:Basic salivary proline-rich protein 2 isoform X1 n=1 Tax=Oopsacas minuta TaxID=111878 RepID=A0AAV7JH00_9METZ|nr:Basic salivary proline-rich protein 2 isoform X1 [Oopsacas minuta]
MFHHQQTHPPFPKESMYSVEIQRVLDQNASIIHVIIDSQHKGKSENLLHYMGQLHANLMWLTKQASINYHMEHGAVPSTPLYPHNQALSKSHGHYTSSLSPSGVPNSIPSQVGIPQNSISFAPAQTPNLPHAQSLATTGSMPPSTWDRPTSPSPLPSGHNPFDFSQWNGSEGYPQRLRAATYMPHQEGAMFANHHRGMHPMDSMAASQRPLNPASLPPNMYKQFSGNNYPAPAQAMSSQVRHSGQGVNTTLPSVSPYTSNPMGHTGLPHMQGMHTGTTNY